MRVALLLLAIPLLSFAQDVRQIVLRSLDRDRDNERASRMYTFVQRDETRRKDSSGKVTEKQSKTHDVTLLEGTPYYRLIARDDKPLSASDQRKEEGKLRKSIEERRKETPAQRAKRIAEWERKRDAQRDSLREIPDAYHLRLMGREQVDGRETWVIEATPRAGFRAKSRIAKYYPKFQGRMWITTQDYVCVRLDAEAIDNISFGWFLAKLSKGAHMRFEQTRVNDEVWLPKAIDLSISARVFIKGIRVDVNVTYKDYKKFQTESRLVSYEAQQ